MAEKACLPLQWMGGLGHEPLSQGCRVREQPFARAIEKVAHGRERDGVDMTGDRHTVSKHGSLCTL